MARVDQTPPWICDSGPRRFQTGTPYPSDHLRLLHLSSALIPGRAFLSSHKPSRWAHQQAAFTGLHSAPPAGGPQSLRLACSPEYHIRMSLLSVKILTAGERLPEKITHIRGGRVKPVAEHVSKPPFPCSTTPSTHDRPLGQDSDYFHFHGLTGATQARSPFSSIVIGHIDPCSPSSFFSVRHAPRTDSPSYVSIRGTSHCDPSTCISKHVV